MMNRFKKVLSLLTAIALLLSGALAFAEETIEAPVTESEPVQVEEIAQEAAPAQEEAAAQEELPTIVEETPAQEEATVQETAPAVEETPAQEENTVVEETPAKEEAPAAEPENDPVPSYNNSEETSAQEEAPAAEETPAQEEAPAAEETPAQEEAPALEEASETEEVHDQEEVPAEEAPAQEETPAADEDPFANDTADDNNETYNENDLITIDDDNWGYIDPEIISDYIPEITTELKYAGMEELKLDEKVGGVLDAENDAQYFIKLGSNKTIVLDLVASSEKVNVTINSKAVKFVRDEESATYNATYTMNVAAGQEYVIVLTADASVKYKLAAEAAQAAEETEEETKEEETVETNEVEAEATEEVAEEETREEETVETNEVEAEATEEVAEEATKEEETVETNEVETEATEKEVAAEETKEEETVETKEVEAEATEEVAEEETKEEEIVEEPVEEKTEENTSEEEGIEDSNDESNTDVETTEEEPVPAMVGWIVADAEAYTIGENATLTATSESELGDQVTWQTKVQDEEWTTAGYGNILTVVLTEENANNIYRFKMEDGSFSDEIQLNTTKAEEELVLPEDCSVEYMTVWDNDDAVIGNIIHFIAVPHGYEGYEYTFQWQQSADDLNWEDIDGATTDTLDLLVTPENNWLYYHVVITVTGYQKADVPENSQAEEPLQEEIVDAE